ncbi:DapH/DapD/GlmU-related protein [Salinimicrobium oceani]|uniref:DapH/DapD/GlmU-related protein n=1 Tax=Salinimicrobium oceani TaxID=2722702 RepID=UPI00293BD818|nr:DapH/DapD/GlmU-related protein [Salinimicrobium oceani]
MEFAKPAHIGADVWIGGSAVICPGVTVGDRTVIGAGSMVTKDLPSDVFAAPAILVGSLGGWSRNSQEISTCF